MNVVEKLLFRGIINKFGELWFIFLKIGVVKVEGSFGLWHTVAWHVDVAKAIGKALSEENITVEVVDAKEAPQNIADYDLVVVGSGLRADKWTQRVN